MHDFLFDNPASERRGGKEPVEVSLFVHKVLPKSRRQGAAFRRARKKSPLFTRSRR